MKLLNRMNLHHDFCVDMAIVKAINGYMMTEKWCSGLDLNPGSQAL